MFELSLSPSIVSMGTLFILAGKWYHDHMTIRDLKDRETKKDERIKILENEQIKIIEALDRTYVSREFLYKHFLGREDIEEKFAHLEKTFSSEMSHINLSLQKVVEIVEHIKEKG